ncbi:FAD-dependent oxidoreductase [Hyphococcus sp.]|uniref:FAD-dependent oxidoreductase n=1 Tax=Hyphococcus sp. TaxID=2038636 RepID=UPI002084634B|nr:MAG: glycine oxidase ThiO [Marinicaulis sp.]
MSANGFDIAIIGGGVIGLTLARALCGEDARVAVIDAGAAIPAATHAAAGMLAPSFEHAGDLAKDESPLSAALYHLGARGLALWPDYAAALEEETGVFVDYRGTGALGLAYDESESRALEIQAARVRDLGGAAKVISGDEARALEPALSQEVMAALHAPQDAQVDPRRLVTALRASLDRRMAPHLAARVTGLEKNGAAHVLILANGKRIEAANLVLASGAISGLVPRGMVHPVKGEAVAVALEDGVLTRIIRAPGAYLCPKAEGRLVIGATEAEGRDDLVVDPDAIAGLKAGAARAAPVIEAAPELERWAGLRPGTPDGAPILGRDGEGRFLALGHYRNGVLHAPAAAQAMAALIVERKPDFDLAPFSQRRFESRADG